MNRHALLKMEDAMLEPCEQLFNHFISDPTAQSSHALLVICVLWEMRHRWKSGGGVTNASKHCQQCSSQKKSKWEGGGIMWRRRVITMPVGGGHPWCREGFYNHMNKRRRRRTGQKENTPRDCLGFKVNKLSSQEKTLHKLFLRPAITWDFLTFLSHVVHAVGHSGALLFGVESREASIVIYKVVVCEKKTKGVNCRLCSKCQRWYF